MADKKKMSVAEILAAARKADSQGGAASASETPPPAQAEAPAAEAAPAKPAEKPAAKPAVASAGGGRPSVKDILAMARAGKSGDAPAAKAPAEKPAAPAAKPAAKPAAAEKAAKPAAGGAKDTASILAAARAGAKPGPISKAEAARLKEPAASPREAKPKSVVPPMPARPTFSKPKADQAADSTERRTFLVVMFGSFLATGFTAMTTTFGLWGLGMARFMFPNILTEPPSRFKVGFPADFPPGGVEEKYKAMFGVWVVNTEYKGRQEIFALRSVCTHLGCTPNWLEGEQKFKCPCHGSGFYKDGINFEGPAPRPLERYAIRLADDGQLEVDKSRIFFEEKGEWADPACFFAV